MEHPGSYTLAAYREGVLDKKDATAVQRHLAECQRCRELVALAKLLLGKR